METAIVPVLQALHTSSLNSAALGANNKPMAMDSLSHSAASHFGNAGGVVAEPECGTIDPVAFCFAVADAAAAAAEARGSVFAIAEETTALRLEAAPAGCVRVVLADGSAVIATTVVLAVNGYHLVPDLFPPWLAECGELVWTTPRELVAAYPVPSAPAAMAAMRDALGSPDPFLISLPDEVYGRQAYDSIVFGSSVQLPAGGSDSDPDAIAVGDELASLVGELCAPDEPLPPPTHIWSGRLAYTADNLPLIGPVTAPGSTYVADGLAADSPVFLVGGYSGNGMTKALRAGYCAGKWACARLNLDPATLPPWMAGVTIPAAFDPMRFSPYQ